jgi:hypothetical protein
MYSKQLFLLSILTIMSIFTSKAQTEQQQYEVKMDFQEFEVRYYPEAILASVYSTADSYREVSSPGFNALAGYIFGGNSSGEKIAMTAPVHMEIKESGSSMSFVMPSKYSMEDLPDPNNAYVKLEKTTPVYMAAVRFGGYANNDRILDYSNKLADMLIEQNIRFVGDFKYFGYNSPYKVVNRRNEVVVEIIWEPENWKSGESAKK